MLTHFALTDIGKARSNNEDHFVICEDLNLYILADGIGGHNYGEVAAKKACETVKETFDQVSKLSQVSDLETAQAVLKFAIYSANKQIYQMALDEPSFKGMGTTLVIAYKFQDHLLVAHVGDSRCYKLQECLEKLTDDHTCFASKSPKSRSFRPRHYLTKSVGLKEFVEPTIKVYSFEPGATYLLCSDGLSDYLDEEKIKNVLTTSSPLNEIGASLLQEALQTPAKDNITFILIKQTP